MSQIDIPSLAPVMLVLFVGLAVMLVALCAAAGFASGDALDEANGVERRASRPKPTLRPVPMADGKLCAWCHPGVDWPTGHGICPTHAAEFLGAARENQMEGGA